MNSVILRGLGTATPPLYATQEEAYEFFNTRYPLKQAEQDLYRRILLDGKIKGRYLGMETTDDALETNPDKLLGRFSPMAAPRPSPQRIAPLRRLASNPARSRV